MKDDPWPARVRDLSSGSIGLLLTRRFEPGTLLVIELEKKKQDQSLSHTLVGRVVHATQNSNGGWMLGCTLANKIAEDDLQDLLGETLSQVQGSRVVDFALELKGQVLYADIWFVPYGEVQVVSAQVTLGTREDLSPV